VICLIVTKLIFVYIRLHNIMYVHVHYIQIKILLYVQLNKMNITLKITKRNWSIDPENTESYYWYIDPEETERNCYTKK